MPLDKACPPKYILQAAAEGEIVLRCLPCEQAVNFTFDSPDAATDPNQRSLTLTTRLRHALEEGNFMLDLFMQRWSTPVLLTWMERDGVSGRDVSKAVQRLQISLYRAVSLLCGARAIQK